MFEHFLVIVETARWAYTWTYTPCLRKCSNFETV